MNILLATQDDVRNALRRELGHAVSYPSVEGAGRDAAAPAEDAAAEVEIAAAEPEGASADAEAPPDDTEYSPVPR